MAYTQKQIYDYFNANPTGAIVWFGDLEDLNGQDYIFIDYLYDNLIGYDDRGTYRTNIQITVATKQFETRKLLTEYVHDFMNVSTTYDTSTEFEYYVSRNTATIIMYHDENDFESV